MNNGVNQCVDASAPLWSTVLMVCSDSRVLTVLKTTTLFRDSRSVNYDQIFKVAR